ncbi:hypothetical protein BLL42_00650 [Pseudomonas frederiksbergensis]|uniref:Delta-60 repeat domain-containing protein n=1 Tax=Pseudomonas frederiksbergensis TaxID=104087 RepID=A0A1J0EEJ8_9PSED|nr:hypothetical protein [Pseudomonas frederiksbergensis]APC14320.1 hypothetical protein BLL42_00650 [Pseudomonas frederiksbergensis]
MSIHNAFAFAAPLNTAGQLDSSFASSGKAWVHFAGSLSSMANDVSVDSMGRLLVTAKVRIRNGWRYGLARLQGDGYPDLSFGYQGSIIGQFESGFEASGGKVQELPDGRILLSGLHYESPHRTLPALAMFDAHGHPVLPFGNRGVQIVRLPGDLSRGLRDDWLPPGVPGAEACDFRVQADGRILLLANHHYELADHVGILIRLNPDGTLDETFNGHGFVMARHLLMNTWLGSLLVQADGQIVVAGSINLPQEGFLARFDSTGRLDKDFAEDGFFSFKVQGRGAQVSQVIEQADGRLQCFGSSRDPMHCLSLTVRSNGLPDIHCNDGDAQLTEVGRSGCQWTAAQVLADGRVLSVGATIGGVEADFILARHLPDGRLDQHFANGQGWGRTRLGRSLDTATSLAVQSDERIVVSGYSLDGHYRAVLARYLG